MFCRDVTGRVGEFSEDHQCWTIWCISEGTSRTTTTGKPWATMAGVTETYCPTSKSLRTTWTPTSFETVSKNNRNLLFSLKIMISRPFTWNRDVRIYFKYISSVDEWWDSWLSPVRNLLRLETFDQLDRPRNKVQERGENTIFTVLRLDVSSNVGKPFSSFVPTFTAMCKFLHFFWLHFIL